MHRAEITFTDILEEGSEEIEKSLEYLRALAADKPLREAVEISSPPLARRWDEILQGRKNRIVDLRRAVRALSAYQLRMATRCTPFGLMAGVAVAQFAGTSQAARADLGAAHRKSVRLERGWVAALTAPWAMRPDVLIRLRLSANNLCRVRGDRLALSYVPLADQDADAAAAQDQVREVSVRHTPAVEAALDAVRSAPLPYPELKRHLARQFPSAPEGAIEGMLTGLVRKEILLTDLRPPAEEPDAAQHVLDTLAAMDPTEFPELAQLRDVVRSLDDYTATPLGEGQAAWRDLSSRMRRLRPVQRGVQVDLGLDADVQLPPEVAAEAERAADLLWRLAPASTRSTVLERYHSEFVERYGVGRAVLVTEVLDPDAGLGAPAGYLQPPSTRPAPPVPTEVTERDRLLTEFAQEALLSGTDEMVVDEAHPLVAHLADTAGRRPASIELFTQLFASSVQALRDGDFRLALTGGSIGPAAATFGRFAYLLPHQLRASLTELAQAAGGADVPVDALRAQLVFQARHGRGDNVAQVPRLLDHTVPVGVFADASHPGTLPLEHLAVCADAHRLRIVDTTSGREVLPTVLHRLNTGYLAPNAARLLDEIGRGEVRGVHSWDWGQAGNLPYVPRVRYGRVVLGLARWRPAEAVRDQDAPFAQWAETLQAWRERWHVPDRVCSVYADQRLDLDLTQPLHLRLLRHELKRRPSTVLQEHLDPDGAGAGWLTGPDGPHRNELVIPLVARTAAALPAEQHAPPARLAAERPAPRRPHPAEHLPGGDWLYATVHCTPARQNELLVHYMGTLLAELPKEVDRWFFIRYRDTDDHLRLRFHGTPQALTSALLPALHRWARALRADHLIQGYGLHTYDPELERYGGPEAIAAAERVFHADSLAAIETLALQDSGRLALEPKLVAAASQAHIARTFWTSYDTPPERPDGDGPDWVSRILDAIPRSQMHHAFQDRRREALALLDTYGDWEGLRAQPGGKELLTSWQARAAALTDYARTLRALGDRSWTPPTRVLLSLLHMHHNRFVGINSSAEQAATAIMRGALQAHRDRIRSTS
ncbi:lantibiotic dehydratase [Streptomyces violascens]|uniref:Lantibiotic dehydratase n=1 Tax=Streptomyces violascens TaxID=67381 RepID=A0ABQ3QRR0_9ACTN|nr:lantibiotic dehydratase [Streptomyces violascens]GHI39958.1 lantibiotic dehydratase [Streptomyces violascens]